MKTKLLSMALGVGLIAAAPVWAESNEQLIARLEKLTSDCQWKLQIATGGVKGKLSLHHRRMENVIADLKAGRPVDAERIEAVLHEHHHG